MSCGSCGGQGPRAASVQLVRATAQRSGDKVRLSVALRNPSGASRPYRIILLAAGGPFHENEGDIGPGAEGTAEFTVVAPPQVVRVQVFEGANVVGQQEVRA